MKEELRWIGIATVFLVLLGCYLFLVSMYMTLLEGHGRLVRIAGGLVGGGVTGLVVGLAVRRVMKPRRSRT